MGGSGRLGNSLKWVGLAQNTFRPFFLYKCLYSIKYDFIYSIVLILIFNCLNANDIELTLWATFDPFKLFDSFLFKLIF